MWAGVLKPTPIIYLVFEKNDLFIYLIEQFFLHIHILFFDFIYPLCKYYNFGLCAEHLSKNMSIFKQGCHKMGPFENWVIHMLFLRKNGAYRIPKSAEKGGHSGRTSVLCHI